MESGTEERRNQHWIFGRKENRAQKWVRELTEGADDDAKDFSVRLTDAEREEILFARIRELAHKGYRLQTQTQWTAQMVSPASEPMGVGMVLAGILTLGIAWIFAPVRRGRKGDRLVLLRVLENGIVEESGDFGTRQDTRFVPKVYTIEEAAG